MASGFNNKAKASELRRQTSWGRTRSPKNILSAFRAGTTATGTPLTLAHDSDPQSFITENQRYLHVVVTANNTTKLKVEGEMYAGATYDAEGKPDVFSPITLKDTQGQAVDQLEQGHYLIEIGGIDRIKFSPVGGNAAAHEVSFYAACSTFSMA